MIISVVAHPNSKNPRVEKDLLGTLHIYVREPPLEGKANLALINAVAEYFKVHKRSVMLIKGERSKNKTFEVQS